MTQIPTSSENDILIQIKCLSDFEVTHFVEVRSLKAPRSWISITMGTYLPNYLSRPVLQSCVLNESSNALREHSPFVHCFHSTVLCTLVRSILNLKAKEVLMEDERERAQTESNCGAADCFTLRRSQREKEKVPRSLYGVNHMRMVQRPKIV